MKHGERLMGTAADPPLAMAASTPPPARPSQPGLEIVREKPPNYEQICDVFPFVRTAPAVVFCFGTRLYVPNPGVRVAFPLMQHELVHSIRQGSRVMEWWDRYLREEKFRFGEELEAHRAEWAAYPKSRDAATRVRALRFVAERLSGPLYGNMVTMAQAMRLVREPAVL